jgi:OOP family OmpA-OmpF porin
VLLGGLALGAPAWAADPPSLKETLGKVQSDADAKAVEDLIDKLKGGSRKPAPTAPAPAAAPSPSPPAAASAPAGAPPPAQPSGQTASPAAPAAPAPAIKPDEAVRRAERSQAPSIDLEIFFAYNSAEITPQAAAALTPLGRALSDARLAGDAFLIAGHSDGKGGGDYNLALSQKRADAVRQYLIATFGIDGAKLVATGMGSKHLKNPKQPQAAENRRVQIVNLSKDERAKPGQR